jgi:hypothetical protein
MRWARPIGCWPSAIESAGPPPGSLVRRSRGRARILRTTRRPAGCCRSAPRVGRRKVSMLTRKSYPQLGRMRTPCEPNNRLDKKSSNPYLYSRGRRRPTPKSCRRLSPFMTRTDAGAWRKSTQSEIFASIRVRRHVAPLRYLTQIDATCGFCVDSRQTERGWRGLAGTSLCRGGSCSAPRASVNGVSADLRWRVASVTNDQSATAIKEFVPWLRSSKPST